MLIHFEVPTDYQYILDHREPASQAGRFPADVMETDHGTTVYGELPGVQKQGIQITFEDDVLTISGKRPEKEIPKEARILLHEQRIREFQRSFVIGHPVDQEAITASLENGLLTVELPKAAMAKPRTITIK